jgi:hypothetical protein
MIRLLPPPPSSPPRNQQHVSYWQERGEGVVEEPSHNMRMSGLYIIQYSLVYTMEHFPENIRETVKLKVELLDMPLS